MRIHLLAVVVMGLLLTPASAAGEAADGPIPSPEQGWPQWHGRWRDGISRETGLLQQWPEGGPKALWTAEGLGRGWSGPIITGGNIYIAGDFDQECYVLCLDSRGNERWRTPNGKAWTRNHPGSRASCCYADGRVYHMNGHGRLACLDAETGKELWAENVLEQFGGRPITWGLAEGVLVHEGKVFATPGGQQAFMVALDAKTGRTAWTSPPLDDPAVQRTGYASPILVGFGGRKLLVNLALRAIVCIDADTGKRYDTFPKRTEFDASCATPVFHRGGIFYTLPTKSGAVFLDLVAGDDGVRFRKKWEGRMDNCNGGAVAVDGYIYGSGWEEAGWVCYDVATGAQTYQSRDLARGAPTYADGRLYCLGEDGTMALVRSGPQAFEVVSRFQLVEEKCNDAWAHPVILDGRLYLRYHDRLTCYDILQPK
ncbi:MAG: PQQ-binding-like beta-propeller repeat protein [Planctomycetota bacterium]|nr:PQQ-binding-like beta-propeller repeat protein [Planctomycetota bacterium]